MMAVHGAQQLQFEWDDAPTRVQASVHQQIIANCCDARVAIAD